MAKREKRTHTIRTRVSQQLSQQLSQQVYTLSPFYPPPLPTFLTTHALPMYLPVTESFPMYTCTSGACSPPTKRISGFFRTSRAALEGLELLPAKNRTGFKVKSTSVTEKCARLSGAVFVYGASRPAPRLPPAVALCPSPDHNHLTPLYPTRYPASPRASTPPSSPPTSTTHLHRPPPTQDFLPSPWYPIPPGTPSPPPPFQGRLACEWLLPPIPGADETPIWREMYSC